jgi:Tfp pilus assembly protein FimT
MVRNLKTKKLQGFSLFELLVTMGILMMLSFLVFPVAVNKGQESKLESYASQLATDIYYQQQRCRFKNITGGVAIGGNSYTLFDGNSLAEATDTDVRRYPTNISFTSVSIQNGDTIFFNNGEFKPVSYGSLTLTDGTNYIEIYINREGLVGYEKL